MGLKNKITGTGVDFAFRKTVNITPEFLKNHGIQGLILDIDNTLTTHDNAEPAEGIAEWVRSMKKNKIRLIIVSNNHPPRVQPFAEKLGLDFVCDGGKPLKRGYNQAVKKLRLKRSDIAAVGDQIFTDVWGANFSGIKIIYVQPIAPEPRSKRFIRFKRVLEKPFLPEKFADDRKENKK